MLQQNHPRLLAIVLASLSAGTLLGMILSAQPASALMMAQQPPQPGPVSPMFPPPRPAPQPPQPNGEGDDEAGEPIKIEQAPKAVQDAIAKLAAGQPLAALFMDSDEGVTLYHAVWLSAGQKCAADLGPGGDVVTLQSAIKPDALPKTITDMIAKQHPKAVVQQAAMLQETSYQVVIMLDGKPHELLVNAAGEMEGGDMMGDENFAPPPPPPPGGDKRKAGGDGDDQY